MMTAISNRKDVFDIGYMSIHKYNNNNKVKETLSLSLSLDIIQESQIVYFFQQALELNLIEVRGLYGCI